MLKKLLLTAVSLCMISLAGNELRNPALNPVKWETPISHEVLPLIRGGNAEFAIAANLEQEKNVSPVRRSVTKAVAVLQEAFKRCAGIDVKVFEPGSAELKKYPVILAVGDSAYARSLGIDSIKLPKEGFAVKSGQNVLVIAGYDGSFVPGTYDVYDWDRYRLNGTLHGAYDFTERFLGCRYYFPGAGTIFPKITDLKINPVFYTDVPYFKNRFSHDVAIAKPYPEMEAERADWEGRYRMARGTRYWAGHSPAPHLLMKKHPDKKDIIFYTDRSGHMYYNEKEHIGNYFDVTNLKFADLLLDDLRAHYGSSGKDQSVWTNFNANSDYITFGQCDTLVMNLENETIHKYKLIPDSIRSSRVQELSNVHARFVFYLAEKIKKEYPGKRLSLIPYHNYVMPPTMPEYKVFPDNIDLRVCVYEYPVYVPSRKVNEKWIAQFKTYYEMLGNRPVTSIWLYNEPRNRFVRALTGRYYGQIPKILGKYLDNTELFWDYHQGGHEWENYYNYYIMWRSQWNPDFNIDAALDEHWKLLYGNAAPFLKEFYTILKERHEKIIALGGDKKIAYNKQILDRLEELLKKAQAQIKPGSREEKCLMLFERPWPKAIKEMRGLLSFDKPQAKIILADSTISIDGKSDDGIWKKAKKIKLKDAMGTGEEGKYPSVAQLAYNERGIYGLVISEGTPLALDKNALWNNCNAEIFLSPGMNGDEFFHYAFDPLNQIHAGQKTMKPVETPYLTRKGSGVQCANRMENGKWTLEFFIPWSDLNNQKPAEYATWQGNIVITRAAPGKEYLSFSMTIGNNHNPAQFGYLKFLAKGDE